MILSKEAIERFKKLYRQEYGVKLSDEQATEYGSRLITMVKAVYGDNLPTLEQIKNLTVTKKKNNN